MVTTIAGNDWERPGTMEMPAEINHKVKISSRQTKRSVMMWYSYLFICLLYIAVNKTNEILYFENFDLDNIITPVNVDQLEEFLVESNYNSEKTQYLLDGFRNGFSIGYTDNENVQLKSHNLKFRGVGNKIELWNKVMKEVKLKRYTGPFNEIPFENYIQSPISLVPKDGGKDTRLIFHLSHPRGRGLSVNENTDKKLCSVKYPSFDEAIELCIKAGKFCKLAKSDMTSAFRHLGLKPAHFRYLVMKAESPIDGKTYYFIDKCLPFGASISCAHFQSFSDAIAHIVSYKTDKDLINYLDNFLFISLIKALCNGQVRVFLEICEKIRFPVSMHKTFWGTTTLTFLGLLINTIRQIVCVPQEKVIRALDLITKILSRKKITLKQLQKICGFLNFLCRAVIPGRAFTRRLYMYTANCAGKLKAHHHIKVNSEMKKDLRVWQEFLLHPTAYARPFMDFSKYWHADEVQMYSDVAKKASLGFGVICGNSWSFGIWGECIQKLDLSMEFLELFAVLVVVLNWVHRYRNRRIILFCDNQSVVAMVNSTTSSCKNCLALLRRLVLHCMTQNVRVFAKYINTKVNVDADLISRGKIAL